MKTYRIDTQQGQTYGVYQADSPSEALAVMYRDAGYPVHATAAGELLFPDAETARLCGGIKDWIVTEVTEVEES